MKPRTIRVLWRKQRVRTLRIWRSPLSLPPHVARVEEMPDERRAGFLAVRTARAQQIARRVRRQGLFVDARTDVLRLGPAPYLRDDQLEDAVAIAGYVLWTSV